ncbi:MAG: hypothetical protein COU90_00355 [Candidatus Ryanbacteria bacterium CG10_big_fil_rev_8_21_14_0_10_43_42]|uniref:Pilus assembly protein PilO n=1 Tax=Candidatus Ryanbacteria bacterium CG10_big_fil_rev_8_21_14_0_10_43_42 TaxID=1974864 RepID=A0A2M8KXV5_9BACT|nr:MAG: hypothetical protein COU90_00355 [Candidatus Ryanbacteria bacterium CG10_big_fil_rev_8_21_14_0_10_43_42]
MIFRIAFIVVFIAGGIGVLQAFLRPELDRVSAIRSETVIVEEAIEKSREVIRLRDELLNRYNSVSSADIERIRNFLPAGANITEFLIDLEILIEQSGVIWENVSVDASSAVQNTARNQVSTIGNDTITGGVPAIPAASAPPDALVIGVTVSGTYDEIKTLFDILERNVRLIDVTDVSFGKPGDDGIFTVTISMNTYYQTDTIL